MPDKSWKAWERRLAKMFGGRRRGPVLGIPFTNDIVVDGWSIEAKLLGRPSFGEMLSAARQAEAARDEASDIPVAIIKRKGDLVENALVVMRLPVFMENFVGGIDDPG